MATALSALQPGDGTLPVPNGGTGQVTLTNHGVLLGAGTGGITQTTAPSSGMLFSGQGVAADPTFTATPVLGQAGATAGSLTMASTGNGSVTVTAASSSATWTLKTPTTAGLIGQRLQTDGTGNSSWALAEFRAMVTGSNFSVANSTVVTNITGLSATVASGRTYSFAAELFATSSASTGVAFAIAGTASMTSIIYEALVFSSSTPVLVAQTRATSSGVTVGAVTAATSPRVSIYGSAVVNVGGTLTTQFAQNVSSNSTSAILIGSTFTVWDLS